MDVSLKGCFILFDSLQRKDTIKVLGDSKYATQDALKELAPYGITSIKDFYHNPELEKHIDTLDEFHQKKVRANISNYKIQRDGLGISTPIIDKILEIALAHGAYGGKFNGSGGGGCLYVYTARDKAEEIMAAVKEAGYPGMILNQDRGLSIDSEN